MEHSRTRGAGHDLPARPYLRTTPRLSYVEPEQPLLQRALISAVERLSGRERLQAVYDELKSEPFELSRFFDRALALADIDVQLDTPPGGAGIPREGPVVFVANHPFGIVDGLILCRLAAQTRGDFRVLLHARLCQDADLAPYFLPVDFMATAQARATNLQTRKAAAQTLREGGTLVIFPGGGVATAPHGRGAAQEFPWSPFVARLVHQNRAAVVPVYFHGQNSRLFHVASAVSDSLRAALLLHEARNKIGRCFRVSVGRTIPYEALEPLRDRAALTRTLLARVAALGVGATDESDAA